MENITSKTIRIGLDLYRDIREESKRTDIPMARLVREAWAHYKDHKSKFMDK